MVSSKGTKYFVVGDDAGRITMFTKNGTLHAVLKPRNVRGYTGSTRTGIGSLQAHLGNVLYQSDGTSWGFIDVDRAELWALTCRRLEGRIHAATLDSQSSSRVHLADGDGTVWVASWDERRKCKVEHRFARGLARFPLELAAVRGFLYVLDQSSPNYTSMMALNLSHVGKSKDELLEVPSPVAWHRRIPRVQSWTVRSRYQQGDLLGTLSENGRRIEVVELIMQVYTPPAPDNLSNFKLPVLAVAAVLMLCYQFSKKGGVEGMTGAAEGGMS
jgi:hypothetical protein